VKHEREGRISEIFAKRMSGGIPTTTEQFVPRHRLKQDIESKIEFAG